MFKKSKSVILWACVFIGIGMNVFVKNVHAKRSLKNIACEAVGCPNGQRPCANITTGINLTVVCGGITYFCYEDAPGN